MAERITVWTAQMTAVLRAHAYGRSTPAEIATMLGVSERAVVTKAGKIGVCFSSKLGAGVRSRIADLAAQGWRPSRIARQVGVDVALVEIYLATVVSPEPAASPSSRP